MHLVYNSVWNPWTPTLVGFFAWEAKWEEDIDFVSAENVVFVDVTCVKWKKNLAFSICPKNKVGMNPLLGRVEKSLESYPFMFSLDCLEGKKSDSI